MKLLLSVLLFFASISFAEVLPGPRLATITPDFFKTGQRWHWKYFQDGRLYSTEKYTVLEAAENRVLIEMATKLAGENIFKVHHRLKVNPQKCLSAYANPAQHKPYSFQLYYFQDGQWQVVEGLTSPLAFEEKFNCNPYRLKSAYRNTHFQTLATDLGTQEVFQQRQGPLDMSSWYFNLPDYPGILAYKNMSKPAERIQYHSQFSLTE